MITTLTKAQIEEIQALALVRQGRDIDPAVIAELRTILTVRGRDWAASVLGRDLSRNSQLDPQWPWLKPGEEIVLWLADREEWHQMEMGLR
jgi:hypothetical protein